MCGDPHDWILYAKEKCFGKKYLSTFWGADNING